MLKVVFMGSPVFALSALQALLDAPDIEVVGVVTQPDRPAGRGNALKMQPVKELALAHQLDIYQPEKLRGPEAEDRLKVWGADVHVVAAYGQILKPAILYLPRYGSINVHASLLPRWRGAAPIQAAVRAGDSHSGITIMKMDEGLDTGDMLLKGEVALAPRETGGSLHDKLAAISGPLLIEALHGYTEGRLTPQKQEEALVTYAPRLEKEDGLIQWSASVGEIDRQVRAYDPAPATYTHWNGKLLKILSGEVVANADNLPIGKVVQGQGQTPLWIGTGEGVYAPWWLQLEGKKRLSAIEFTNGNQDIIGATLG